ncbi:MAG: AAA family ATPase [Candidatus Odinarchaeia archaeon]
MELDIDPVEQFQEFYKTFKTEEGHLRYRDKIRQMSITGDISLVIDFDDLLKFDAELAKKVLEEPNKYIDAASEALKKVLEIEDKEYVEQIKTRGESFNARFRNLPQTHRIPLRKIRAEQIGKLIMVDGILTRASEVKPQIVLAAFRCQRCGEITYVPQEGPTLIPPLVCQNDSCRRNKPFKFLLEESKFIDWQKIRIQEKPEELPPGQLPRSIDAILTKDLVDTARPGDRVSIIGVLKSAPERSGKVKLSTFKMYIEANYVDVSDKELEKVEISPEEEQKIIELSKDPWIHQKIINSIAPSIYGYEPIKEAIALQLFGGVSKTLPDGMKIRGESNILIVGDPGTAKSQLLQYAAQLSPRGLYTSGKGSSAAGLTAAVIRDEGGGMSLEAGALVLADQGLACVDEFDKMRPEDRSALHEAMEQRSYHPNTEILLADGRKIKIGDLVDNIITKEKNRVIKGSCCEILHLENKIPIFTSDFTRVLKGNVSTVSRHTAPEFFVDIKFSNGRNVVVTPDHPFFVYKEDGRIEIKKASDLKVNDLIPSVRFIPNSTEPVMLNCNREICLENNYLTNYIAKLIGYLMIYGRIVKNNFVIITKNIHVIQYVNKILAKISGKPARVYTDIAGRFMLKISDAAILDFIRRNFPEVYRKSPRFPAKVAKASRKIIKATLSAILSTGKMSRNYVYVGVAPREFAEDIQDFLLKLGMESQIVKTKWKYFVRIQLGAGAEAGGSYNTSIFMKLPEVNIKPTSIVKIKIIPNKGNRKVHWVYDVGVEPFKCFVNNGVVLHNSVSIAKAGIVATLNARTSILAAANPALGRYNPYRTPAENINLPVTLLSRFDLLFVLQDRPDKEQDEHISEHILNLHRRKNVEPPINAELLKKYIMYARRNVHPVLSEEAAKKIKEFYLEMRGAGEESDAPVPITARQLEALVRLTEARAKMALREEATVDDAEAVINLMKYSLRQVGIDRDTGKFDIDTIMVGRSKSQRDKMEVLMDIIKKLEEESGGEAVPTEKIIEAAEEENLDKGFTIRAIESLKNEGLIFEPKPGYVKKA